MNRHEDDESTGHSSQSSRHSSRLFKYDDITILIGKNSDQVSILDGKKYFLIEIRMSHEIPISIALCEPSKMKFIAAFHKNITIYFFRGAHWTIIRIKMFPN